MKADIHGCMDVIDLEEKIKESIAQGKKPFLINATCGTTVLGAYDPLKKIAEIGKKYDLWTHVMSF